MAYYQCINLKCAYYLALWNIVPESGIEHLCPDCTMKLTSPSTQYLKELGLME